MRKLAIFLTVLAFALSITIACGDEEGQSILTIASILQATDPFGDTVTDEGGIPSDTVDIVFDNDLKNPGAFTNITYADIIIESLTVSFTRTDGGSDKPATFKVGVSYKVPANGSFNLNSFTVIPATLKTKFPISDLIYYGYERSTNFSSIKMDITIEAEGHTIEGIRVYAKGKIAIELTNWAD